jgi:hypothetical protein
MGHPGHREFDPRGSDQRKQRHSNRCQEGRPNPDAKTAICRIVDSRMRFVKSNHGSLTP